MPYLAAAALKDEVLAMENGLDTVIGSSGTRLSGGQAQRLALARTLAHPSPVLILDDPFSALDRSTEDTVFAALQAYANDNGRLPYFAPPVPLPAAAAGDLYGGRQNGRRHAREELMASVPAYRQLYESQTGGTEHEDKAE